ncbi:uncharacterized protein LOC119178402 [Rhipicephalus microplus]|uniref:Uncharacterized protein n=1 Tax=Rhipicephalus microplus TaxID=6941 RepID=A0A6M2D5J4_RHIMP
MKSPDSAIVGLALCAFLQLAVGVLTTFPGSSSGSKTVFPSSSSSGPRRDASGSMLSRFSEEEEMYADHDPAPSISSGSTVNFPDSKASKTGASSSSGTHSGGTGASASFPSGGSRSEEPITFVPREGKAITFQSFPGGPGDRAAASINGLPPIHQIPFPGGFNGMPKGASQGLPDARSLLSSLVGLGGANALPMSFGNVNVSDIAAATNRVADELSRSLRMDVRAVSKALAVGGAALGSLVFLGGMAAMMMSGLGFFNYPGIYAAYPYSTTYGTAYPNQYRSAKSLNGGTQGDAKRPVNPNLVPAINDLIGKLAKATQEFGMPK